MRTNYDGINLIKCCEGLRLQAYLCPAGVPTIGYGHTEGVHVCDHITPAQAEAYFAQDLRKFEVGVGQLVQVDLNANQFSALVSFAYNEGIGALKESHLLLKVNTKDWSGVVDELAKWIKAEVDGKMVVLPGLVTRRKAEATLFERLP